MDLDLAEIDYEDLRESLCNLPVTWYPDLLRAMVNAAYKKKVFLPNKASEWIAFHCENPIAQKKNLASETP